MILGYLDAEDRAYDLNFATLRMKVWTEAEPGGEPRVVFAPSAGPGITAYRVLGEAGATASVGMDHHGDVLPLLRPVEGRLLRHERGLLFLASPARRDPADPCFFLVKLRANPSAVKFFFEDREGSEMVSVPNDEVLGVESLGGRVAVRISAASLALPKEKLSYVLELSPGAAVAPLLRDLPSSGA